MALIVSLFFGFVPMFFFAAFVYWLDRYEKEPKILLWATFFWGVVIAAGGAFIINTAFGLGIYVFTGSENAAEIGTTSIVAPIVEEALKGLAVLIVFFMFRKEFDSVLDGIIYGGIAALGFAATENTLYIFRNGYQEGGWGGLFLLAFIRVIIVGWQHPFYTAFTGIGLAVSRTNRNLIIKLIAPLIGFGMAVTTHAFHNTFGGLIGGLGGLAAGTFVDWIGWTFMFGFIIWMISNERNIVKRHLHSEMIAGLISQSQYQKALSPWTVTTAGFSGKTSARFYQVCGELSHKKEQIEKHGDESGNMAILDLLRKELALLAPQVK
ncbi:PrsW family intramembrane metalloprotease [Candidatus Villigracilis saccharophilus]|uniref:PrsW family intramembrane metalloprotease n=1 Tax=Candidatus Villigracilis saccharophilus TaxID=3140684 RepID=UPI00313551A3|nr:PrsW family intramembrane metalloprotease [Anaerolineales bacterium]